MRLGATPYYTLGPGYETNICQNALLGLVTRRNGLHAADLNLKRQYAGAESRTPGFPRSLLHAE